MYLRLSEFDRELVLPGKIDTYESGRQYLTYGNHLGPVIFARSISGDDAESFHRLVQNRFRFPRPGIHYVITDEEIYSLLLEWNKSGFKEVDNYIELDHFYCIMNPDSILSYFWEE